jgi:hypothetical protein
MHRSSVEDDTSLYLKATGYTREAPRPCGGIWIAE